MTAITSPVSYLTEKTQPDSPKEANHLTMELMSIIAIQAEDYIASFPAGNVFLQFHVTSIKTAKKVQNLISFGNFSNLFQAFAAWVIAKQQKKKFLLEIRDLYSILPSEWVY